MSRLLVVCLLALTALSAAAVDESDLLPVDEAFVLEARAPSRDRIEFSWKIADGYYLYRHQFKAQALDAAAFVAQPLELPDGVKKNDPFFGETETYREQVVAALPGHAAADVREVEFEVRYQGCADVGVCYPPQKRRLRVSLPPPAPAATGLSLPGSAPTATFNPLGGAGKPLLGGGETNAAPTEAMPLPAEQAFRFEAIAASPTALLLRFTPAPGYYLYRDRTELRLADNAIASLGTAQWPAGQAHKDEHFGDVVVYFDQVEVPVPLTRHAAEAGALQLEATFQGCQRDGICYPPMTRQVSIDLPAAPEAAVARGSGIAGLLAALLLALGGGLILNLMPCVLPVLSLKVLGLAGSGESTSAARKHALWYTAGVLVSFAAVGLAAIALRQAGLALGWGFQLQQPLVVAALAYVMFAVGLSLSGLFQIGAGWAGMGQSLAAKSGPAGDFFTGVLAVVVAAPCTAPFMGPALAYAFAASPAMALAVFLALGLGLALPFLLIGFIPALAQRLPRPGAWMNTLKQLLAFPMYLTAAWLASVLAAQRGADGVFWLLVGAVALAAALWAREHWRMRGSRVALGFALLAALAALLPLRTIQQLPSASAATHAGIAGEEAYSAARLAALRAEQRVVFVNMTADWCVTCKLNEKTVLSSAGFHAALQAANAVYMKGDWTNIDPEITAFLEQHGAVGVPLYVVFAADGSPGKVLPTVLTPGVVEDALRAAVRR